METRAHDESGESDWEHRRIISGTACLHSTPTISMLLLLALRQVAVAQLGTPRQMHVACLQSFCCGV